MQNKHRLFSCFWCPNVGGGGVKRLGQNPKFCRKFFWTAPLTRLTIRVYTDEKDDLVPSSASPPWKFGHVNWEIILYLGSRYYNNYGLINNRIQFNILCDHWEPIVILTFGGISSILVCRQSPLFGLSRSQGDPSKPPDQYCHPSRNAFLITWCSTSFWSKRTGDFASFGLMQRM